ncbi:N-acetylglucosamine-6-phosphate deacetylase [Lentibacillus persicus]|uniref:N-acetylglucosamine-6-phosphate deacetylase n=1 Tax=Lentibacillus persicus TaxID=640948 RepID=A0A1I1YPI9_9BACI|nr:amidohydrolase family protein [Lentibacillus persicus]SFE21441.1 N-acetylglucosamine-6-phosphate deacetylase [Lentibacillus persicus]
MYKQKREEASEISNQIEGIHYKTNEPINVYIENGKIKEIKKLYSNRNTKELDIIAPGLIDLQINGFKGIDFNNDPLKLIEWETVTKELSKHGLTSFYPTIITNSFENLQKIFQLNYEYLSKRFENSNLIQGFHLEGPYISKEDGPRGAHNINYVRSPNLIEFKKLQETSGNLIKILTISPEWSTSNDFIKEVTKTGTKIALGHTSASENQINQAIQSGALFSTHLGNGTHTTLPRHNNYLWDQLAAEELSASVVADGHHLPLNLLKIFNKVKKEKMFLVSDSVALAGLEPGEYETFVGGKVRLTHERKLHLHDNSNILAGSAKSLIEGVSHLVNNHICSLAEALDKASVIPASIMNLPQKYGVTEGSPADLIQIRDVNGIIQITKTIKKGQVIYEGS